MRNEENIGGIVLAKRSITNLSLTNKTNTISTAC